MGRSPAPWLARAYELLADGQWRERDRIVNEMVKKVPPGRAYRRGTAVKTSGLSDAEFVRRGARHICYGSLSDSKYIRVATFDGVIMVRRTFEMPIHSELVTAADEMTWESLRRLAAEAERACPGVLEELGLADKVRRRLHPE